MASQEAEDGTEARRSDEVHDERPRSSSALSGGGNGMSPRLRRSDCSGRWRRSQLSPVGALRLASPDISDVAMYDADANQRQKLLADGYQRNFVVSHRTESTYILVFSI